MNQVCSSRYSSTHDFELDKGLTVCPVRLPGAHRVLISAFLSWVGGPSHRSPEEIADTKV